MRLTNCWRCGVPLSRGHLCYHCRRTVVALAIWASLLLFNLCFLVLFIEALR